MGSGEINILEYLDHLHCKSGVDLHSFLKRREKKRQDGIWWHGPNQISVVLLQLHFLGEYKLPVVTALRGKL